MSVCSLHSFALCTRLSGLSLVFHKQEEPSLGSVFVEGFRTASLACSLELLSLLGRMVNASLTDTSTTSSSSAAEASASSSAGSSVAVDTMSDPPANPNEEAEFSLGSPSQFVEDKENLDTKKDQDFD